VKLVAVLCLSVMFVIPINIVSVQAQTPTPPHSGHIIPNAIEHQLQAQIQIQEQIAEKNLKQSNSIIIASVLIEILGIFIASYSSFKRQYTKGGGEGADLGQLPLDGGRPNPDVENKKRRLQIIGFTIIVFGLLLSLLTVKFSP
jgi:hypothetical protein